jgi:hypothetical protein
METPENPQARLFRHAKREAWWAGWIWLLSLIWTVAACYLLGYQHAADDWVVRTGLASVRGGDDLRLIFGLPDWVVIGILGPWMICTLITLGFAQFVMRDDELGEEMEGGGSDA